MTDISVNAILEDNVVVFPVERSRLREALDPSSMCISDGEIDEILRIVCGDLRRATVRCLLKMQAKAYASKDREKAAHARRLMMWHDGGILEV